ncbi:hypothetical protein [Oryza sativa Japonica Group]|uniref:Uncharacterized protein n=1 Tax=Oryza sativa subsp. japonica TaxID=39947 RepID=Q5JKC8_ORYSJ|nr:hypothetical protein [Oryza sativa Japonica Group]
MAITESSKGIAAGHRLSLADGSMWCENDRQATLGSEKRLQLLAVFKAAGMKRTLEKYPPLLPVILVLLPSFTMLVAMPFQQQQSNPIRNGFDLQDVYLLVMHPNITTAAESIYWYADTLHAASSRTSIWLLGAQQKNAEDGSIQQWSTGQVSRIPKEIGYAMVQAQVYSARSMNLTLERSNVTNNITVRFQAVKASVDITLHGTLRIDMRLYTKWFVVSVEPRAFWILNMVKLNYIG